ncbi:MAG: hypothetical protein WD273_08320 [Trueperaceae bacterium]
MERHVAIEMLHQLRSLLASPFKAAVIYIVVAAVWILLSDRALLAITDDPLVLSQLQTAKGWGSSSVAACSWAYWMQERGSGKRGQLTS